MASLDSVRQKVFRAAIHAKSLEPELEGYFKTNPGKVVVEPQSDANDAVFTFQPKDRIPARFGLIIGDCLQNLRSSLDYLVWELVLAANNQPSKDNMFPICSSSEVFEDQAGKRKRLIGIHADARALIKALQPYHLGQDWQMSILWVLDELTNINKHRRVLLTMLRATQTDNFGVIDIGDGRFEGTGPMPTFDDNAKIRPFPATSGQMQMEAQVFAGVTFDEGAAKGKEITWCLNGWMDYILNDIVPRFERFFVS